MAEQKSAFALTLLIAYLPVWIWAAINPLTRIGWFLENILVFIFVPLLIWSYRRFRLSNISYALIFVFLVLHTIGSHYTYEQVPFGYWLKDLFDLSRNHYDRIVHFSFGLLMAYPVREIFLRIASTGGFWGYWLPFEMMAAFSGIFEIFEWLIVALSQPTAGSAYLGTQGDEWDAQKDMALACVGALITMGITAAVNWTYNRHFKREIAQSLTVKHKKPLGEVGLAAMKKKVSRR
jgi:putative membrane protein